MFSTQINRQQFQLNQHFAHKNRMKVLSTLQSMANRFNGVSDSKKVLKCEQTIDYSHKNLNQIIEQANLQLMGLQASNKIWKKLYKDTQFQMPSEFDEKKAYKFLQKIRNSVKSSKQCLQIVDAASNMILNEGYELKMYQKCQKLYATDQSQSKGFNNQKFIETLLQATSHTSKVMNKFQKDKQLRQKQKLQPVSYKVFDQEQKRQGIQEEHQHNRNNKNSQGMGFKSSGGNKMEIEENIMNDIMGYKNQYQPNNQLNDHMNPIFEENTYHKKVMGQNSQNIDFSQQTVDKNPENNPHTKSQKNETNYSEQVNKSKKNKNKVNFHYKNPYNSNNYY